MLESKLLSNQKMTYGSRNAKNHVHQEVVTIVEIEESGTFGSEVNKGRNYADLHTF